MWRWLNVPRSMSWPVSRSGVPSVSSDASASASACAQSTACRSGRSTRFAAALELFGELRVDREALGDAQQLVAELAQRGERHRSVDFGAWRAVELVLAGARCPAAVSSPSAIFVFSDWWTSVRLSQTALDLRSMSVVRDVAGGLELVGEELPDTLLAA